MVPGNDYIYMTSNICILFKKLEEDYEEIVPPENKRTNDEVEEDSDDPETTDAKRQKVEMDTEVLEI